MKTDAKTLGLIVGPVMAVAVGGFSAGAGLGGDAQRVAAVATCMIVWWVTEAIPIYVTAFMPAVMFPLLGVMNAGEASKSFGHPYVLMLLGAFMLAKGLERQGLHKRIALVTINALGTNKRAVLAGFMITTAFLSMWITNMAVVLIMLPIATSIAAEEQGEDGKRFGVALLLGVAYAASIGGTGTLIGTPPNLVFAGMMNSLYPDAPEISFLGWMKIGVPVLLVFIPLLWVFITRFFGVTGELAGGRRTLQAEIDALPAVSKGEMRVGVIFALTALGWIFRRDLSMGAWVVPGWSDVLGVADQVHDSTVALVGAGALFMIGDGKGQRLMDWSTARQVPWGVAMFLGGGLALGSGFKSSGLAESVGQAMSGLSVWPAAAIVFAVVAAIIFITEVNSNTATATIFLPVLAAMAVAGSINPLLLMIPATFACSFAFMLPSGTGTNTVIFASERISIADMVKTGIWFNLVSLVVLPVLLYFVVLPLLGVGVAPPAWAQ